MPNLAGSGVEPAATSAGAAFPARGLAPGGRLAALELLLARRPAWAAPMLLAFALLVRWPLFGNPVVHVDEQFYLLVGDRVLRGALPFVDVWDRKPVGLFLLYAAMRWLGGEGVLQFQLVATVFAAATAFAVAQIAARFARPLAALLAGAVYLLWLGVFGGESGQSPVFYNLPVALAAWLTLRAGTAAAGSGVSPGRLLALGCGAMLLAGLALQIKYTAVFEGCFLGLALLWAGRRAGLGAGRLARFGLLWVACALLFTAVALLFYASLGHAEAFVYANFISVFERSTSVAGSNTKRLLTMSALLLPLLLCAALGRWPRRAPGIEGWGERAFAQDFVVGWCCAAVGGVLVFGTYYDHYALPVLVPLAAAAAPRLLDRGTGPVFAAGAWKRRGLALALVPLFAAVASSYVIARHVRIRGDGSELRVIAEFLRPRLRDCLYVHDADPILYHLTDSCLPSRYVFPGHLVHLKEAGGIGTNQDEELRRVLDGRPGFIVSSATAEPRRPSRTWPTVLDALDRDYRQVFGIWIGRRMRYVFERRPDR